MGEENIPVSNTVRNIGAMFDREIKMDAQVSSMCKNLWYHLHMIQKIRHYLTFYQTKSITYACITSKLDGNNTLLDRHIETWRGMKGKLQLVQNADVELTKNTCKHDHVIHHLRELYWLLISKKKKFQSVAPCFKSLNSIGPVYLNDLLTLYKPKRQSLLHDPLSLTLTSTNLITYGDRSFRATATLELTKLPTKIWPVRTVEQFKRELKTHNTE